MQDWQGWVGTVAGSLGLAGGAVAAFVSLRRLPGQAGIDKATREQLVAQVDQQVWTRVQAELDRCQAMERALRLALDAEVARTSALIRILREAGMPIPADLSAT